MLKGLQDTPTQSLKDHLQDQEMQLTTTAFEKQQQQRIRQNEEAEEYISKEQVKTQKELSEVEINNYPERRPDSDYLAVWIGQNSGMEQ